MLCIKGLWDLYLCAQRLTCVNWPRSSWLWILLRRSDHCVIDLKTPTSFNSLSGHGILVVTPPNTASGETLTYASRSLPKGLVVRGFCWLTLAPNPSNQQNQLSLSTYGLQCIKLTNDCKVKQGRKARGFPVRCMHVEGSLTYVPWVG